MTDIKSVSFATPASVPSASASASAPAPASVTSPSAPSAASAIPADNFDASAAAGVTAAPSSKAPSLSDFFMSIPVGTKWVDLTPKQRRTILDVVDQRVCQFNAQWDGPALAAKSEKLRCDPSETQTKAFNEFVSTVFANQVPAGFKASRSVKNPELLGALKDLFLCKQAEARCFSQFYDGIAADQSGAAAIHELPVPSRTAYRAAEKLAQTALDRVNALDASKLDATDAGLVSRLQNKLGSMASGSLGEFGFGGNDLITPIGRANWGSDALLVDTPAEGDVYHGRPDAYIRDLATYWLSPDLGRVNAGTVTSTMDYALPGVMDPAFVSSQLGDPATNPQARAYTLLGQWFGEKLTASKAAQKLGYDFSPASQTRVFNSWQSDELVPVDRQQTIDQYRTTFDGVVAQRTAFYKQTISDAIDALFPAGGTLTDAQRAQVKSAIDAQQNFGTLVPAVKAALDTATGNTDASTQFQAQLDGVGTLGGLNSGDPISAAETAQIQTMWDQVKAYLGEHYSDGPVKIASLLQPSLSLSTTVGGTATDQTGNITIDLAGAPIPTSTLYSSMLHEAKHSIDMRSGQAHQIQGSSTEGAAETVEQRVTPQFLAETFKSDPVKEAFAQLARLPTELATVAKSDANLSVLTAPKGTDGVALATSIGQKWGLAPDALQNVVDRAYNGMQYAQYFGGQVQYDALLDYLQQQVQPKNGLQIDPYVLQEYNAETSAADAATVAKLKAALG